MGVVKSTRNAARAKDPHYCSLKTRSIPPTEHGGSLLADPGRNVHIDQLSAVVVGDLAMPCENAPAAVPLDAVIGGNLSVFINGSPAARSGDLTFGGYVGAGCSEQVFHNDEVEGLSQYAADWLVQYLAQLDEIPFPASQDGCFSRAHAVRRLLEKRFGVTASKFAIQGDPLQPRIGLTTRTWVWHIAAAVPLVLNATSPEEFLVLDPSLNAKQALRPADWAKLATGSGKLVHTEGPIPGASYKPSKDPVKHWDEDNDYEDTDKDIAKQQKQMSADPDLKRFYGLFLTKGLHPVLPKPHVP